MRILMLAALLAAGLYGQTAQNPRWIAVPGLTIEMPQTADQAQSQPVQTPQAQPAPQPKLPDNLWPLKQQLQEMVRQYQQVGGTPPPKKFVVSVNPPATACAIPLLNVGHVKDFNGDPKMVIPLSGPTGDSPGIVKPMPVCGER